MSNKKKWTRLVYLRKWREVNKRDNLYKSYWILKFLNKIIKQGKKHKFEKIFYNVLYRFKTIKHPLKLYYSTIFKSRQIISTHFKRFGKFFHRIPYMIKFPQSYKVGLSSVVKLLLKRRQRNVPIHILSEKIYSEIYNINYDKKLSSSVSIKKEISKMVRKNRAFLHFRWK